MAAADLGKRPQTRHHFCQTLSGYVEGITASALYRLNTSVLEGINNRIKVIKRMAYGYRDSAYFFLKISSRWAEGGRSPTFPVDVHLYKLKVGGNKMASRSADRETTTRARWR